MSILKFILLGIGITPTLFALLVSVALYGQPQPCRPGACPQNPYGAEVLILPTGTCVPLICGFLAAKLTKSKRTQRIEEATERLEEPKDVQAIS
jgi:hypothetical protein